MKKSTSALTVSSKEVEPCHIKLDIEVPVERVNQALAETVALFRTSARIPGFRKGKAPRSLLRNRFRKQIEDEVQSTIVRQAVEEACEQEGLSPETTPRLEDEEALRITENVPFAFAVTFDLAPAFDLPKYQSIKVSRESVDIDDGSVQEVIDRWLQQRASYDKVARPAAAGDLLKVTYHGRLADADEPPAESAGFLLDAEETWLALREPEILPGAATALVGAEPNTARQVRIEFPADYGERSLAGKAAEYTFDVLEVHGAEVPAFTDDMAKEIGAADAAQAREQVRQNLQADKTRRQEQSAREQVVTALLGEVDFPLPPVMLARETYQAFARICEDEMRRGASQPEIQANQKELAAQAKRAAALRLKRFYVLSRVADAEGIQVDKEELNATVTALSRMNRISPKVALRRLRDSGRVADVVTGLRESKTIDHVLSMAEVTEAL